MFEIMIERSKFSAILKLIFLRPKACDIWPKLYMAHGQEKNRSTRRKEEFLYYRISVFKIFQNQYVKNIIKSIRFSKIKQKFKNLPNCKSLVEDR